MKSLHTAVDYLYADQGWDACPTDSFLDYLDDHKDIDWERVDAFLATLSKADLKTFSIGDQEDMQAIVQKHGEEGEYAHMAMDALFEDIGT